MPEKGLWPADPKIACTSAKRRRPGTPFSSCETTRTTQRIVALADERARPRSSAAAPDSDVAIEWDDRVRARTPSSRGVGRRWYVEDDGLSRNGTFVNEQRVHGASGLRDGDVIRVGHTTIVFRTPPADAATSLATAPESRLAPAPPLSAGQRRVLEALCRPCLAPGGPHPPATNEQIAAELHLSVDAVKAHLRQLFRRFDIEELPQIQKRTALVRIAIETGILRSAAGGPGGAGPHLGVLARAAPRRAGGSDRAMSKELLLTAYERAWNLHDPERVRRLLRRGRAPRVRACGFPAWPGPPAPRAGGRRSTPTSRW